jgi:hypothetical protein
MKEKQDNTFEQAKAIASLVESNIFTDAPIAPVISQRSGGSRPVFTGMEDHTISVEDAGELTRNYRKSAAPGAVKGKYFSRAALEQLLAQEDAVGIRYYYGIDNQGKPQMVLVGVNGVGQDLHEGFIFGNPRPISRFHSEANPLNS